MVDDFTGNRYWQPGTSVDYPKPSTPMDPSDHPATSMPTATEHHAGTDLGLHLRTETPMVRSRIPGDGTGDTQY